MSVKEIYPGVYGIFMVFLVVGMGYIWGYFNAKAKYKPKGLLKK